MGLWVSDRVAMLTRGVHRPECRSPREGADGQSPAGRSARVVSWSGKTRHGGTVVGTECLGAGEFWIV